MSFIAVAGLAITAGAAAYSGYQASQGPDDPSSVFGKKPKTAPYTPIDLSEEQLKASRSNLQNADSITALLDKIDPGFSDLIKKGLDTSGMLVSGQLPQDVQDQIMRSGAFQSLMNGFGGTGMAHALTARDIGRSSVDMFQIGTNAAQQWTKMARDAYQPFLITTADEANVAASNNIGQQETLQRQYNTAAAPDPAAAGEYNMELARNQQMQQSLSQVGGLLSSFSRQYPNVSSSYSNWSGGAPYATNAGSLAVPRAELVSGPAYVYDPSTGTYRPTG